MQIIVTYDSDVANAPAAFKACVNAACQYLDALFTNPITVRIGVGFGTLNGQAIDPQSLGESLANYEFASLSSAAAALSAQNAPGASTVPTTSPSGASLVVSAAQAKALSLDSGSHGEDGYVGFATGNPWAYDPTDSKPVPFNSYDFVGTVLHEVTETLGRVSDLDVSGQITLLDMFRYAAAGQRQLTTGDPSYFSVDGGVTKLLAFNNFVSGDQGDLGDWATANRTNDSFNDDSFNGVLNPLSSVDKLLMQAIGYTETAASQALTVASAVPVLSAAAAVAGVTAGQDLYVQVTDSGAGVSAQLDGLETLAKNENLAGITLTSPAITLSVAQMTSDADALAAISGDYSPSVADSAADIQANLALLQSDLSSGKVVGAAVTNVTYAAITVTAPQESTDSSLLSVLSGNFYLIVDATASDNVSLTGLSGKGTVVELFGSASQYTLTPSGDGSSFAIASGTVSDHLSGVTALSFGGTLDFVAATPANGGNATTGNITELYAAVLAREPDVPGLAFYQAYLKANPATQLTAFATYFLDSTEYTGNSAHNYAASSTGDASFIQDSYQNLLHRTPSAGEVSYYQTNVMAPAEAGLAAGSQAFAAAQLQAHALMLVYFSNSGEFLSDVQITAAHPADTSHWLYLI